MNAVSRLFAGHANHRPVNIKREMIRQSESEQWMQRLRSADKLSIRPIHFADQRGITVKSMDRFDAPMKRRGMPKIKVSTDRYMNVVTAQRAQSRKSAERKRTEEDDILDIPLKNYQRAIEKRKSIRTQITYTKSKDRTVESSQEWLNSQSNSNPQPKQTARSQSVVFDIHKDLDPEVCPGAVNLTSRTGTSWENAGWMNSVSTLLPV